ncbi:hypothetical protein HG536_0A06230 [Torulaspora globosa]|uniref:Trafficking protein particle complex subunit n=1 Tax=Torulaspora globosa TaxID=48254 RepID=A0A7G3ZBC2_9SACH|nr:uncharacterized protein HG536_0A06230 [Torulaspora globosa]QLL30808.1 hypothetical protein HG536_0A06230 [Torulaspora globosa]
MSQRIILPSNPDGRVLANRDGYDYTIGPKQSLPNEASAALVPSRMYSESLIFRKHEVSLSAMAFLFQSMIVHVHSSSKTTAEFESRLSSYGFGIGSKLLELLNLRASIPATAYSRSSNFLSTAASTSNSAVDTAGSSNAASAVNSPGTPDLGNRTHENGSESLASLINNTRSRDLKIIDMLQFVHGTVWSYLFGHVSDDLVKSSERDNEYMIVDNQPVLTQFVSGGVSCDYFVCGIIQGFLNTAKFPCRVSAHCMPQDGFDRRVVYLIQFDKQVLEREGLRFPQ